MPLRLQNNHGGVSPRDSGRAKFPPPVLWIVLGAILFIFSAYEVIERTWLVDADPGLIYFLHIARGVGASITVTILAVSYVLRTSPPIFPSESSLLQESAGEDPDAEDRIDHFGLWFVRMRWIAGFVAAALVVIIVKVLKYLDDETFLPLMSLVFLLFLANGLFTLCLRRGWFARRLPEIQIGTDLVLLSAMLHFSGGIENPLLLIYVFHIMIGGILLSRQKCYAIVFLAIALLSIVAFSEMAGLVNHYTLSIFPHATRADFAGENGHADTDDDGRVANHPDGKAQGHDGSDEDIEEPDLQHAAHDRVYVVSLVSLLFLIMILTAFFITTIMDRLREEELAKQSIHQRLQRVVQATGAGMTILDKSLEPVWMNEQLESWLRNSDTSEPDPARGLREWAGGTDSAEAKTIRDGKVRIEDRRLDDGDGNSRFFQVTVSPLRNLAGEIYEVVLFAQDITEHKMLEEEMIQSEKMMVLGIMAAGIAHEVGNPLASISTRLRLLEETQDPEKMKNSLQLLQDHISRIARIVHGVSSFARPSVAEKSLCHINVPVSEALDILRFHRLTKVTTIHSRLAPGLPEIQAAKDHLVQVFLNLGLNALEAMPEGGDLTVRTYSQNDTIRVTFEDTGKGIQEDLRSKVFDTFFSTKKNRTGMGMGLSIARNIVKSHGGEIELTDNPGGGTIFTVILHCSAPSNKSSHQADRSS